jgi:hypothetical protein
MQIKQKGKSGKRVAKKKKHLAFFCCFCECKKERNPLRGIFAEMTVCIYQFFIRLKYYLREKRERKDVEGVIFFAILDFFPFLQFVA